MVRWPDGSRGYDFWTGHPARGFRQQCERPPHPNMSVSKGASSKWRSVDTAGNPCTHTRQPYPSFLTESSSSERGFLAFHVPLEQFWGQKIIFSSCLWDAWDTERCISGPCYPFAWHFLRTGVQTTLGTIVCEVMGRVGERESGSGLHQRLPLHVVWERQPRPVGRTG